MRDSSLVAFSLQVQKFKSNEKDWANLGRYIQENLARVIQSLPDDKKPPKDLQRDLERLRE